MVQDQLTPKFSIKNKNKTSVLMQGSQFPLRTALPLACSRCVGGWRTDPWGEGPRNEVCPGWLWLPYHCEPHLYLIPSSRVCNHEVNQNDTRASITQAPIGVTCLFLERVQRKKKRKKRKLMYISEKGSGVGLFQLIPSMAYTMRVIEALHLSL